MPKKYLNSLNLKTQPVGNEQRIELLNDILKNGTFLPKTVEYKDIDTAVINWVNSLEINNDEGKKFPTMSLFSNQRFSEYSQSWQYVDENNNLLLNFKTVTRNNNPQLGDIQGKIWNIPGERFYTMKRIKCLDDNGTESYLTLKMKQPVAIDLSYKISVFTTKYSLINEFNTLINKKFSARQCYISPNGHYMPMILENINDESKYDIEDRQFYSQTYEIKVLGYIITENDFKTEESPLKIGGNLINNTKKNKINVEIEEPICESSEKYSYQPFTITVEVENCNLDNYLEGHFTETENTITITDIVLDKNIAKLILKIGGKDGEKVSIDNVSKKHPIIVEKNTEVYLKIKLKYFKKNNEKTTILFHGFYPMKVEKLNN